MMRDNHCVLITGAAGFVGAALSARLLREVPGIRIVGLDNLNDYYDVSLKLYRLEQLENAQSRAANASWTFVKGDISDRDTVEDVFSAYKPDIVVHLAAQAGVRYSIVNPEAYLQSNLVGFFRVLEACRHARESDGSGLRRFLFASSSSVYGFNEKVPYSVEDRTDEPASLYAATKKSDEVLAYSYAKLYGVPTTGLRFFTVYGPAGRPDMAYFSFTKKLLRGEKIQIFNYGDCQRDFTYIDDVTESISCMICSDAAWEEDHVPFRLYNIGNSHPENLMEFTRILHEELVSAGLLQKGHVLEDQIELLPMQPGDVRATYADASALERDFGFRPKTPLRDGLKRFAEWYSTYYGT